MIAPSLARRLACALFVAALAAAPSHAQLVNSEWNAGSGAWNVATNWFPNDVPDNGGGLTYDVQIGNRPVAANATVTLVPEDGTSDTITALAVSGGADLQTNGNALFVTGQTTISGVGSSIFVEPASGGGVAFNTDNLDINSFSALQMAGGTVDVDVLLEVNSGSITGHGLIIAGDADGVAEVALENSASIFVGNLANAVLTLQANGVDTLDLDGASETGTLDVANVNANVGFDTLTLVVDGPLSDAFGGTLLVGQRDTITFNDNFTMDGADVQFDGGTNVATMNGPADVTNIQNSTFTVTGDVAISNSLTFSGPGNTVTINANSSLTLSGTVNLPPASFNFASSSAELIVTGIFNSNVAGDDFNWDGPGTATTTVSGNGQMIINVDHVDTGNDTFGGTLNLNDSADVSVNNTANEWTMAGTINKNNANAATLSGDRVIVTGAVNANAGTLDLPAVTTTPTTNVNATGTLLFGSSTILGGGTLAGTGLLRMEGTSTVLSNTTIGVATFDWDGVGTGTTHTINAGVTFTINSAVLDNDGDMDDPFVLAGNLSQLVVNNTNGLTQWTANGIITANASTVGTATIGGTSRVIVANVINVDGNTNISAPVTFNGTALVADIDAGMTLDVTGATATYADGTIDGGGTFDPASSNTVTGDFAINADRFDFDGGTWTVQSGATLTTNSAVDYEPDSVTNSFESTITLNNGAMFVNVADAAFVMNGTLNMNASGGFDAAEWQGDAIDIGNDAGALDANLNVTGDGNPNSQARFLAPVTFRSDADVDVPAGATLVLNRPVTFETVNGVNNAEFTGAGTLIFGDDVNVNEAATLNMVGGTVDLDGNDAIGDFVNIDAPLTINAATMSNFGRVNGGGVNTLDVNNSVGTGTLTVNLDDPEARWTLNGPGVMNLVNDSVTATLLAGNEVNINGTLNVTGDVRTNAALHIAGVVNINTPGQRLILNGDDVVSTIAGGTVSGPGILSATAGRTLSGFGTINTDIDFDGSSFLRAEGGTLTITGDILDVVSISATGLGAVLNVVNPWDSGVAGSVGVSDGVIQGGAITNNAANGITGRGTVTARVVNNTRLTASGGTLLFQTAGNDNDWDGAGAGLLRANGANSVLELRDTGVPFGFTGTVEATNGGRVLTSGFALDFNPGSTINLNQGTYESTNSTNISGAVTVGASGIDSFVKVQDNRFLTFESTSFTTLDGNLILQNNNIIIEAGAGFVGDGLLVIDEPSHAVLENGATINAVLLNAGAIRPGNSDGIGTATVKDYVQTATGELFSEILGSLPNQFDRLQATGIAQVDGRLIVDLDGGFDPALGAVFDVVTTAFGVSGAFDVIDYENLPAGKTFAVSYLPNAVRLTTVVKPDFAADFDNDGDVDATDYQIWVGAYALNQVGDATGDNISNAADYTIWRDQLGSGPSLPSVAVPEPGAWLLGTFLVFIASGKRRRQAASGHRRCKPSATRIGCS